METEGIGHQSLSSLTVEDKSGQSRAFCKTSQGWTCTITRATGPDAGKIFVKCGGNCTCVIEANGTVTNGITLPPELQKAAEGEAFCQCGQDWSCIISKTEAPDAAKSFSECAGNCSCVTAA